MNVTADYKGLVLNALLDARKQFEGSDAAFARQYGINSSVFSRLQNSENTDRLISDGVWVNIGRMLDVRPQARKWNVAKTSVFTTIEEEILFCKDNSKSRIFIDDCGIGKTFTARYLSRTVKNCFYLDCSQTKTQQEFVRSLARALGLDNTGRLINIKENIKYYLHVLTKPVVILDEVGDMNYNAFMTIKELWNATEGVCGFYMIGADGLRSKIERGIACKRVGFREVFSRFSEKFGSIVPLERGDKISFYRDLITSVLVANAGDKALIPVIVKKCLIQQDGNIGGLRRAESLLILNQE